MNFGISWSLNEDRRLMDKQRKPERTYGLEVPPSSRLNSFWGSVQCIHYWITKLSGSSEPWRAQMLTDFAIRLSSSRHDYPSKNNMVGQRGSVKNMEFNVAFYAEWRWEGKKSRNRIAEYIWWAVTELHSRNLHCLPP